MRYTGFHRALDILHREEQKRWSICLGNQIDASRLDELRQSHRQAGHEPPSYTALVVKAIAAAIRELSPRYPELNSTLTGFAGWKTIHAFDRISAGVAISRDDGGLDRVITCVVEDPDQTDLPTITRQLADFSRQALHTMAQARSYRYLFGLPRPLQHLMLWVGRTIPELRRRHRGTFTLTSVGKFGVDYQFTLPQASCLQFGFGSVRHRPVVRAGQVVPAPTFHLTLSFDRRLINGKPCSILMERIREILETADFGQVQPHDTAPARSTPVCS